MLSRITRITTSMGPQVLGGCSLLRDAQTAPKVAPTYNIEQHILHDHAAYCKISLPPRQRNSSSSCDPFLGIGPGGSESMNDLVDLELSSKTPCRSRVASTSNSTIEDLFSSVRFKSECEIENESDESFLEGDRVFNFSNPHAQYFVSLTDLNLSSDNDEKCRWDAWESPFSSAANVKIEEPDVDECSPSSSPNPEETLAVVPNIKPEQYDDYEVKPECSVQSESNRYSPVDGWYYQPVVKKRGVTLKPRVDDETERRRAMNRVAALRYRERKRRDKHQLKMQLREMELRNRDLKQQEVRLLIEISTMKSKLHNA